MKTIIYARVSSESQSCEPQLLELRNHAALRGITVSEEITDVISGSKASREGLDRLLTMVRAGKVKTILAVKLDRLARSLSNFVALIGELNTHKVSLIIPGQGIDTTDSNPGSRFIITVFAAIAELERDFIRERTKAGLAVARASGKVLGRPSLLMPGPLQRPAIVAAWRAATGGRDYDRLAAMLGGVSRATAWRVARSCPAGTAAPEAEVLEVD